MTSKPADVGESSREEILGPSVSNEDAKFSKKFTIRGHATVKYYNICAASLDKAVFYVLNKPLKRKLTLHSGSSETGPVLGMIRFGLWHEDIIGLGDPDSNNVQWEKLVRGNKMSQSLYHFEFGYGEGRKSFTWRTTRFLPWKGIFEFQLVEDGKPDIVLAQYYKCHATRLTLSRQVLLREGCDEALETMAWLTLMAVVEGSRRRSMMV